MSIASSKEGRNSHNTQLSDKPSVAQENQTEITSSATMKKSLLLYSEWEAGIVHYQT